MNPCHVGQISRLEEEGIILEGSRKDYESTIRASCSPVYPFPEYLITIITTTCDVGKRRQLFGSRQNPDMGQEGPEKSDGSLWGVFRIVPTHHSPSSSAHSIQHGEGKIFAIC